MGWSPVLGGDGMYKKGASISTLSDVDVSALSINDVLMYNGSEWVCVPEGTTFSFSVASLSDGESTPQIMGEAATEWKAAGALTFTVTYVNGPPTSAHIDKTAPGWTSDLTLTTPFASKATAEAVNYPAAPGAITFSLHAAKGAESDTETHSITFWNRIYYGGSTLQTGWTQAQIKALTDVENGLANASTGTWNTVTLGANEYFVFAFPSRLTDPTNWYDNTSGFMLSLKSSTPETVSIANDAGSPYTENYDVFVSNQILGPGTFQLRTT